MLTDDDISRLALALDRSIQKQLADIGIERMVQETVANQFRLHVEDAARRAVEDAVKLMVRTGVVVRLEVKA